MKRSEFLKKLGIGLGVAVVAPTLLANNTVKEEIKPLVGDYNDPSQWKSLAHLDMSEPPFLQELVRKYPITPNECYPYDPCGIFSFDPVQYMEMVEDYQKRGDFLQTINQYAR